MSGNRKVVKPIGKEISHIERTRFFAYTDLITDRKQGVPFWEGTHCEEVVAAIRQPVTLIYLMLICLALRQVIITIQTGSHFEFWTFDTRFRFANDPRALFTPPCRRPAIWAMSELGTTSWFLEPISTCWSLSFENGQKQQLLLTAVNTLNSSEVTYRRSVASSFIFVCLAVVTVTDPLDVG